MKIKLFACLFYVMLFPVFVFANDGVYYTSGNQLIPIMETDISVKKEILSLKKNGDYMDVTVYYEFYNPGIEKKITVGFEAKAPLGDIAYNLKKSNEHPFIQSFSVNVNSMSLPHKVTFVDGEKYVKDGRVQNIRNDSQYDDLRPENYWYMCVYHFDATFKKGLNIVKHAYRYHISSSIMHQYNFEYILTAANRWANKQIDDFTLNIDVGDFVSANIKNSFYKDSTDWIINGIGKKSISLPEFEYEDTAYTFHIRTGSLVFKKLNFHPAGELFLYVANYWRGDENGWDYKARSLPFDIGLQSQIGLALPYKDTLAIKILRNLPFARRGYVFKDKAVQAYYESLDWYLPDPKYIPNHDALDKREKLWIEVIKK